MLNDKDTVAEWVGYLEEQVSRFLSAEGDNPVRLVNNLDWTAPMSAIDFLRDIGKHYRVGTMLKKDAVSARLNSAEGISYTEFSYQILQGMDFLQLHRDYGCVLQTGGSDQWGNLTSGVDLIHKADGHTVHAIGTPLITNSDGTKFGKSEGNAIWLDAAMCSPYAFYQFWLNSADADVIGRLKVFTFLTRAEIEALEVAVRDEPFRREAQRRLASEVTTLVHGAAATEAAIAASAALFGDGDLAALDEATLASAVEELPRAAATSGTAVAQAMVDTGLSSSLSDARRAIQQGGVYLNNVEVEDVAAELGAAARGWYRGPAPRQAHAGRTANQLTMPVHPGTRGRRVAVRAHAAASRGDRDRRDDTGCAPVLPGRRLLRLDAQLVGCSDAGSRPRFRAPARVAFCSCAQLFPN